MLSIPSSPGIINRPTLEHQWEDVCKSKYQTDEDDDLYNTSEGVVGEDAEVEEENGDFSENGRPQVVDLADVEEFEHFGDMGEWDVPDVFS